MNACRIGGLGLALLLGLAARAEETPPKTDAPVEAEKKEAAAPAKEKTDAASADEKQETPAPAGEKKEAAGAPPALPLKSEWFEHVVDQRDDAEEAMRIELHALEDILVALQASTDEHLKQNVDGSVPTETAYKMLMEKAEEYRGHVIQLRGVLEVCERFPIPENKSGLESLQRGQISTITGKIYTFFSIQKPPDELMKRPVRITGIFLKRYAYKNRLAGEKLTWTPVVFIRGVEKYSEADVPPGSDPMSRTTAILVGVFLTFIVVRVILEVRRQRAKAARANPFAQARAGGLARPVGPFKPGPKKK